MRINAFDRELREDSKTKGFQHFLIKREIEICPILHRKSRTDARRGSFCRELHGESEFEVEKKNIFARAEN